MPKLFMHKINNFPCPIWYTVRCYYLENMNKLKWQKKSSKIIYQSEWLTLIHDEVLTPDNKNAAYDIVERKDFVLVIPKLTDSFYMVNQYRYPINYSSLEFPQGFCENGETIEESVQRELEEETGLRAKKLTLLDTLWVSSGFLRQKFTVFLAEDFTEGKINLDDTEVGLTKKKLTLEDISKKITTGEINNAPTVAALGLYLLFTINPAK